MEAAILCAVSLAAFLPSRSVAFSSDQKNCLFYDNRVVATLRPRSEMTALRRLQTFNRLALTGRSGSIAAVSCSGCGMASMPYITYYGGYIASVRIETSCRKMHLYINRLKSRDRAQN
jgi:hypothetical protein